MFVVELVFCDWMDKAHRSVYAAKKGVDLSSGPFHSGTTFDGLIRLDPDDAEELEGAIAAGYLPMFHLKFIKREPQGRSKSLPVDLPESEGSYLDERGEYF